MDLSVEGILNHQIDLPQIRIEPRWTVDDTHQLFNVLEQISNGSYNEQDYDWNRVGNKMKRSPMECRMWFEFLKIVMRVIPFEDRRDNRPKRKRNRRKAGDIQRMFKCQVNSCPKVYGTEGALKFHMKNKHKEVKYIPSYLYQYNHSQQHMNHKQPPAMIFPDGILFKSEPGMPGMIPTFVIPTPIGGQMMSGMSGGMMGTNPMESLSLLNHNDGLSSQVMHDDISHNNNSEDDENSD